jgi:ABC-type siderophore export system fused ATPase/permease subunit
MPIIQVIVLIVVVGVILYLVNTYVPMAAPIKTILNIVVILFLVLWLLSVFGLLPGGTVPRLRTP